MMTKQTEALQMALNALINCSGFAKAIQACKEALEQPAQEPVAWVKDNLICPEINYETTRTEEHPKDLGWTPLYSHPAPQPAQEPVAWRSEGGVLTEAKLQAQSWVSHGGKAIPLYTHPAPSWQGLSDDERFIIVQNADWDNPYDIAELIEQALKEKNT